jgi:predicted methyltransferase
MLMKEKAMKNFLLAGAAFGLLAACGQPETPAPVETPPVETPEVAALTPLQEAVNDAGRSDAEKARDAWRHPIETLEFFGVEPSDTVVEIWPGGGWYTNILAPYLAAGGGKLVAAGFDPAAAPDEERKQRTIDRLAEFKSNYTDPRYGTIEYSVFSGVSGPLTEAGTADAVLTFRNVHNWMSGGYTEKFFTDAFAALKPGGVLGVVEHRLPSTATQDPTGSTGYVHEDFIKARAIAAGFEFVGSSEINANPADTADHPFGVWTLPPVSTTADSDGNTPEGFDPTLYADVGESDRMTLKFVKPD